MAGKVVVVPCVCMIQIHFRFFFSTFVTILAKKKLFNNYIEIDLVEEPSNIIQPLSYNHISSHQCNNLSFVFLQQCPTPMDHSKCMVLYDLSIKVYLPSVYLQVICGTGGNMLF